MRFLYVILLSSALSAASARAAEDKQVSFRCDGEGNLLSFRYGGELTFDSSYGALSCDTVDEVAELCRNEGKVEGQSFDEIEGIYEALVKDATVAEKLGRGEPLGKRLAEMKRLCDKRGTSGNSFTYSYPFDGYTRRNIGPSGSNEMNKEQFRRVAELAVAGGIDPFLAMSVLVTEQTPLAKNTAATEAYFAGYGVFPVDARPAFSFLKCSVEKSELAEYLRAPGNPLREHLPALEKIRAAGNAATKGMAGRFNELIHRLESLELLENLHPGADASRRDRIKQMTKESEQLQAKIEAAAKEASAKLPRAADEYQRLMMEQYVTCWDDCIGIMPGQCRANGNCPEKSSPIFHFDSAKEPAVSRLYCAGAAAIVHGGGTSFEHMPNGVRDAGRCCFHLEAPASSIAFKNNVHATGALGLRAFWDDKMLRGLKIVKPKNGGGDGLSSEDAHKLARIAQMWNGWGRMNVTEKIGSCMGQLNMATHPVIGGKVMDLTVNSTLTNPYLTGEVMKIASRLGKPVKSMLCLYGGKGDKRMSAKAFHAQINGRYLSGTACK